MKQQIEDAKAKVKMIKTASNPNLAWKEMLNQNPQLKGYADMINSAYRGDPKAAFYAAARSKGLNDQQIDYFLSMMGKEDSSWMI